MRLGENIYNLRKGKGLSQEKLAEKINVTRQTISNWELGETSPNPEQLILLSDAFGRSIDELVGNEIKSSSDAQSDDKNALKKLYWGLAIICGCIAWICSVASNRCSFLEEILYISLAMVGGACLGAVCHGILKYVKSERKQ